MRKRKLLIIPLLLSGLMCLTGCADFIKDIFTEDDLTFTNKYNPPVSTPTANPDAVIARGVEAVYNEKTPNAYCFKSIGYANEDGLIPNTYKDGAINHVEYNVNGGEDYNGSTSGNNYDLYVPKDLNKNEKHVAILFIHGGAWISGFKTDVNEYVHEFATRGYITATIKYSLLKRTMDNPSLSIFRNLDEIDACISSIKLALEDLEFDTTKTNLVIGGASSGAHLSMLYAYSRGQRAALPISFLVDAVGPVDIKPANWKSFTNMNEEQYNTALNEGLSYEKIEALRANGNLRDLRVADTGDPYYWNEYHTMRIANGMCGIPFSLEDVKAATDENEEAIVNPNAASTSLTKDGGGEDQLSVTYWINSSYKLPIICAYAGKDAVVGVAQYAVLEKALIDNDIEHSMFYFKNSNHTDITKEFDETAYTGFVNKIASECEKILL